MTTTALDRALWRDRLVIASVLALLTVLSWIQMVAPEELPSGERLMPCCGARFDVAFAMWVVMMAGMMIPSVAPMVLAHASVMRRRKSGAIPYVFTALFLGGYLLAWSAFSAVAALTQWVLFKSALLDGHTLSIGPWAGGAVLLAAGVFQLSPAKNVCLSHCRVPFGYFVTEWREGYRGAVAMGLRHGVSCIGCCWLLMAVLFAVGIMNILWGAAITAFVLAEKVLPWRKAVVRTGGVACLAGAALLVCRAVGAT
jgi:predicted metal-binding membrane protein